MPTEYMVIILPYRNTDSTIASSWLLRLSVTAYFSLIVVAQVLVFLSNKSAGGII